MNTKITLDHGSGGEQMQNLIAEVFHSNFNNEFLSQKNDSTILPFSYDSHVKENLVFTTDAFVINPHFFPGGDIGKLSICGTVNDLAVSGAKPLYLSAAFIIEEGFEIEKLKQIVVSMASEAKKADVKIVAGDTKVVRKGDADGLFITTSGVGTLIKKMSIDNIKTNDAIIVNGSIGEHGLAVMAKREGIDLKSDLISDCACLNIMIEDVINSGADVKFMRDATRGGIAAVLNEIVQNKNFSCVLDEKLIPQSESAKAICELLGFDVLNVACEGRVIAIVNPNDVNKVIEIMKKHKEGKGAVVIGNISDEWKSKVVLNAIGGGKRVVAMPSGELLPRIC